METVWTWRCAKRSPVVWSQLLLPLLRTLYYVEWRYIWSWAVVLGELQAQTQEWGWPLPSPEDQASSSSCLGGHIHLPIAFQTSTLALLHHLLPTVAERLLKNTAPFVSLHSFKPRCGSSPRCLLHAVSIHLCSLGTHLSIKSSSRLSSLPGKLAPRIFLLVPPHSPDRSWVSLPQRSLPWHSDHIPHSLTHIYD